MKVIYQRGSVSIIKMPACVAQGFAPCSEFFVYNGEKLVRVCPSEGMAREVAAGC